MFDSAERQRHYLSAPLSRWQGHWQVPGESVRERTSGAACGVFVCANGEWSYVCITDFLRSYFTDVCAVPKAVRLVEGNGYIVEVVSSHCWDVSMECLAESAKTNHMVLTRTGVDGREKEVNVLSVAKQHLKWAKRVRM